MNQISRAEIGAEVGYNAAKDFTFLQIGPPEFSESLIFPLARGSKEDMQIRVLFEDRKLVNFKELTKILILPSFHSRTFGIIGSEEDDTLTPENYPHLVLLGKADSGAHNLLRFWLLWAARQNMHIISVANPDLYGVEPHINPNLVHHLDASQPLREQMTAIESIRDPFAQTLVLVGSHFEPNFEGADAELMGHIQNRIGDFTSENIYSVIHLRPLHMHVRGSDFFGSEGSPENVSYAVIGDVNERTARVVGGDVPTRNPRGVAWFRKADTKETKRVRTFLVPKALIEQISQRNAGK